jgi:hypothetical protein
VATAKDLTGQRFGRLVVSHRGNNTSAGKARWFCLCDCGGNITTLAASLTVGYTRSCGCIHKEQLVQRCTTHGQAKREQASPEYRSWCMMKARCTNENFHKYKTYGAVGITYDPSWDSFEQFLKDMGPRPKGTSLDRIDPYGNYEPSNCRWADAKTQANNTRR